jgi:hypothetical protein
VVTDRGIPTGSSENEILFADDRGVPGRGSQPVAEPAVYAASSFRVINTKLILA